MNILLIGGWLMTVNDGNPFWSLKERLEAAGHQVRVRECAEDWWGQGARQKVTLDDVLWTDAVTCYSYGMASFKDILHDNARTWPTDKVFKMAVIVAGVPDWWMGQCYGFVWQLEPFIKSGRCLQVSAIPGSAPITNELTKSVSIESVATPWIETSDAQYINIDIDKIIPHPRHTEIVRIPWVIDAIYTMLSSISQS